jgi:ketosteroid isomerase-like protein
MIDDKEAKKAVQAILDAYARGYAKKDVEGLLALCAPDCISIGTGEDEWRDGLDELREQLERDMSQSEEISVDFGETRLGFSGNVAWMSCRPSVSAKVDVEETAFTGRFTCVLEKRRGEWLVVQSHFSLPAAEQAEGESFPA